VRPVLTNGSPFDAVTIGPSSDEHRRRRNHVLNPRVFYRHNDRSADRKEALRPTSDGLAHPALNVRKDGRVRSVDAAIHEAVTVSR